MWIKVAVFYVVAVALGVAVGARTGSTAAGLVAALGFIAIVTVLMLRRGFRVLGRVDQRTHSQGDSVPSWRPVPGKPRCFIVEQPDPHFEAKAQRLFGLWYSLEIINTLNGEPINRAAASIPLTGRSSVNRAVKYGILRFYAEHPTP